MIVRLMASDSSVTLSRHSASRLVIVRNRTGLESPSPVRAGFAQRIRRAGCVCTYRGVCIRRVHSTKALVYETVWGAFGEALSAVSSETGGPHTPLQWSL